VWLPLSNTETRRFLPRRKNSDLCTGSSDIYPLARHCSHQNHNVNDNGAGHQGSRDSSRNPQFSCTTSRGKILDWKTTLSYLMSLDLRNIPIAKSLHSPKYSSGYGTVETGTVARILTATTRNGQKHKYCQSVASTLIFFHN